MYKKFDVFIKFINGSSNLNLILNCIKNTIDIKLEKCFNDFNEEIYSKSISGIRVYAYSNHDLLDDCGIQFSRYSIQVGFEALSFPYGDLRERQCRVLALLVANAATDDLGCECIVVEELQKLIASTSPIGS